MAIVFVLTSSVLINLPMAWTSVIDDEGNCWPYQTWPSQESSQIYTVSIAVWTYVLLLCELVFCYGSIVLKLRRKGSVAPGNIDPHHQTPSDVSERKVNRYQANVIKTMIVISVTYAMMSFCETFGYVIWSFNNETVLYSQVENTAYIGLYFVNAWLDPIIYMISNHDVRQKCVKCMRNVCGLVSSQKNGSAAIGSHGDSPSTLG